MSDNPITAYYEKKDKSRVKRKMTKLQQELYNLLKSDEGNDLFFRLLHANDETLAVALSAIVCIVRGTCMHPITFTMEEDSPKIRFDKNPCRYCGKEKE